jgi:hypothetical protein
LLTENGSAMKVKKIVIITRNKYADVITRRTFFVQGAGARQARARQPPLPGRGIETKNSSPQTPIYQLYRAFKVFSSSQKISL